MLNSNITQTYMHADDTYSSIFAMYKQLNGGYDVSTITLQDVNRIDDDLRYLVRRHQPYNEGVHLTLEDNLSDHPCRHHMHVCHQNHVIDELKLVIHKANLRSSKRQNITSIKLFFQE